MKITQRLISIIVVIVAGCLSLTAQTLSVASFRPLPNDLTANMAGTQEKDQNGDVAALIKVVTTQTGFGFEGGVAGVVKTKQELGEIWVYVPHGIKKITIKHPQLGVLRDYYFPCAIEAARTYELVLTSGEVRTVVTQDLGVSYLVLNVSPKNASVYIDGVLQQSDASGEYLKALPYGEHQYRLEVGGFLPEAGVVQIGKDKKVLNVTLKSALAKLTVNSTTQGTQIFVNEQKKGVDTWNGSLGDGIYVIEGRKEGYNGQKLSVTLASQEEKTVTIPALQPMFGTLNVAYKPNGAEVLLDDKPLGTSPDIFKNILVGNHKITIKKQGYKEHTENIIIAEGEVKEMTGVLSDNLYPDFKGKIPAEGTEAREIYEKAIKGDAEAQNNLGSFYEKGNDDVSRDSIEAVKWYRKAAEQGNASAQYHLGQCYGKGIGVCKDYAEAVKWCRKAAEQGNTQAQTYMGICYGFGRGVNIDYAEAVKWYRKAAEQGNILAQFLLGGCYEFGRGANIDYAEAVKWYRKSAEQGSAESQSRLGLCYELGRGVGKDYAEAIMWYRKAAEQGCASGQLGLGSCYEEGRGVVKNINEAVKWYRKAAEQGDYLAKETLKRLEAK